MTTVNYSICLLTTRISTRTRDIQAYCGRSESRSKRGGVIVCAATACSRARLRTEPRPSGSGCAIIYDAVFSSILLRSCCMLSAHCCYFRSVLSSHVTYPVHMPSTDVGTAYAQRAPHQETRPRLLHSRRFDYVPLPVVRRFVGR